MNTLFALEKPPIITFASSLPYSFKFKFWDAVNRHFTKSTSLPAIDFKPLAILKLSVGYFEPKLIIRSGSSRYLEKGLQVTLKLTTNDLCGTRLALIKVVG